MVTRNGIAFGVLTASVLIAGLALGYQELLVLGVGLLLAGGVALGWLWFRPDLEVSRVVMPNRVEEEDSASAVLTVTNKGRRRFPSLVATETLPGELIDVKLPGLAPGDSHRMTYRLPARRRGCYAVGPLIIGHHDPLKLVSVVTTDKAEATLWVLPHIYRVSPVPTTHSQETEGPTSASAPRGGIAFHSLRDYEPGDDPRLIHWRSTARTGRFMVKHTVITNEPRIMVVLDTSSSSYSDDSFEDAVRVAASLVVAGAERRYPTYFRTTGGIEGFIDPSGTGKSDVLDKLAAVQPTSDDEGLEAMVKIARQRDRGVALGVVTGQPEIEKARAVSAVRSRFDMVSMVQVGERFDRPPLALRGVLGINVATSEDFVTRWKSKVR